MTRRRRRTDADGQLSELMLQILLVLTEGPQHGYAMLRTIEERSGRPFRIGPATLYRTLQRLLDADLIEEAENGSDHSQRRAYRLTAAGLARAKHDAVRLARLVDWARSARVLTAETGGQS